MRNHIGSFFYSEKVAPLHCTFQNLAMYKGSVSTFADLCVAMGTARRHVQGVCFWHLKFWGRGEGLPCRDALRKRTLSRTESDRLRGWLQFASNQLTLWSKVHLVEGSEIALRTPTGMSAGASAPLPLISLHPRTHD